MTTKLNLDALITIAESAGNVILDIYARGDFDIQLKSDNSPLTAADKAAHQVIEQRLSALAPKIPVLSEESANIPFSVRQTWERYWLVDPLDGTKEFIKRNGEFTVNIALIEQGESSLGIVHAPVSGWTYFGTKGCRAYKKGRKQPAQAISVTSKRPTTCRVAGSRSHAGKGLTRFLENMGDHEIISMGSSLKFCLVAEGLADIYPRLGPTSEWDTAAAQAVVEAAGGKVTDTEGRPLRYNTKDSYLNPCFLAFGDYSEDWRGYIGG